MTLEQQAFASILPSWTLVRQGEKTGARYQKGELTIHLVTLSGLPRAVVFLKGKLLYKGAMCTLNTSALLDVKSYLDRAFPGMA